VKRALAVTLVLVAAAAYADDEKKLTFETPKEWKEQAAKTGAMAPIHEWKLEKADGDDEEPVLKVYHWANGVGTVDENVKRWAGLFKTKDGDAFPVEKAKKETFESNGLKITTVEIEGTFTPPAMMGGGDPKKGQKLIAAYVDGPGGPWTVKLQGPVKSIDKVKDAYVKWLKSAKTAEKSAEKK